MLFYETDLKYSEFTAPVRKGRNNRHSAGCDEGKAFPFELINMMGYTKNETAIRALKDVWDEKLKVEYGDTGKDYGNYTVGDDKITLSSKLLGGGREGSAKLAAVMSHESTHYYGERREAMAHLNGLDTYSQINKLFKLKGDSALSNEMLAGVLNAENWKENSGDVDHWTMAKNDDGKYGWREDGRLDFYLEDGTKIDASYLDAYLNGENYITSSENVDGKKKMIKALKKAGYSRKERKEFLEGTTGFADASVIAGEMLDGTLSQKQIDALNSSLYAAQESGLLVKNKIGTIYDTSLPFVRNDENDYTWVTTQYGFDLLNGRIREHNALDMVVNTPSDGRYETGTTKLIVPETSDITLSYGKDIGLKETFTFGEGNQIYYGHMDENSVTSYLAQFGTEGVSITSSGHLHNVPGGMLTGYVGNTGAVTTNPHLHLGYSTLEFNQENLEFNMVSTNPNEYFSSLQNIAVTPYAQVTSGLQGINSINDNLNLSHVMNYYQFVNNPNQNYNNHYNFDDFYSSYSSHMNSSAFTTATIMYLYNQRRSVR